MEPRPWPVAGGREKGQEGQHIRYEMQRFEAEKNWKVKHKQEIQATFFFCVHDEMKTHLH